MTPQQEAALNKMAENERELGIQMQPAREWVGLTDEEIMAIGRELGLKCRLGGNSNIDFDYARAIEAKLREKNA